MLKTSSALVGVLSALALSFLQPSAAVAGTIFFNDSNDPPFVTTDTTGRVSGGCVPVGATNVCTITLLPPSPPPEGGTSFQQTLNILEMAPGNLNTISDTLTINPTLDANFNVLSFTLVFTSGDNLSSVGGNIMREDGTVQTASSINWFSPTGSIAASDLIQFQSTDIPSTASPEPATALLMLAGFGLSGISVIRRRTASRRA
jgi:hypothetical protein